MSATPAKALEMIEKGAIKGSILIGITPRNRGTKIELLSDLLPNTAGKGGRPHDSFRILSLSTDKADYAKAIARAAYEGFLKPGMEMNGKDAMARMQLSCPELAHFFNLNGFALGSLPAPIIEPTIETAPEAIEEAIQATATAPAKAKRARKPAKRASEKSLEELQAELTEDL